MHLEASLLAPASTLLLSECGVYQCAPQCLSFKVRYQVAGTKLKVGIHQGLIPRVGSDSTALLSCQAGEPQERDSLRHRPPALNTPAMSNSCELSRKL